MATSAIEIGRITIEKALGGISTVNYIQRIRTLYLTILQSKSDLLGEAIPIVDDLFSHRVNSFAIPETRI